MGGKLSKAKGSKLSAEREPLISASAEQEKPPVQCLDDQAGLSGVVVNESDNFPMSNPLLVDDNLEGSDGDATFI